MATDIEQATQLRLSRLLAPMLERARLILLITAAVAVATAAYSLVSKRKFEASVTVTTISSPRSSPLVGAFPAALLSSFTTGLQPTPALIARLTNSRTVINEIARSPVPTRGDSSILQLVDHRLGDATPDYKAYQAITRTLRVTNERETGLVTLSVVHSDSGLARIMAAHLLSAVTDAFQRAARAQATELRQSQERRVDSVARQLRHAEEALAQFTAQNRIVSPFSPASVTRDRLSRELDLAQSIYTQVITEREAAIGKELEETPAVAIVDPVPRELVPVARNTAVKVLGAALAAFVVAALGTIVADMMRNGDSSPERDRERIHHALERLPRTRGLVRRWASRNAA